MSASEREPAGTALPGTRIPEVIPGSAASCALDAQGHCVTCSDEALPTRVLRVEQETGLALVTVNNVAQEIDISLVEGVEPGTLLLVHGGVAIACLDEESDG